MTDDLARLRNDLAVMRMAAGLEPAWPEDSVRTHLLLAAAGGVAAAWALLPHGLAPILGMVAFVVPVVDWVRHMRAVGAAVEQDRRDAANTMWYALPFTGLALWSRAAGLDAITLVGLMVFMLGFVLFGSGLTERGLRPLLGWSLAFMVGGLMVPLKLMPVVPVIALAIAAGALIAAAWIATDRRRHGAR